VEAAAQVTVTAEQATVVAPVSSSSSTVDALSHGMQRTPPSSIQGALAEPTPSSEAAFVTSGDAAAELAGSSTGSDADPALSADVYMLTSPTEPSPDTATPSNQSLLNTSYVIDETDTGVASLEAESIDLPSRSSSKKIDQANTSTMMSDMDLVTTIIRVPAASLPTCLPESTVLVTGSFVGWAERFQLRHSETDPGILEGALSIPRGCHQYKYIVDGNWVTSSEQACVDDGLGGGRLSRLLF
jgi:hypothetical protein